MRNRECIWRKYKEDHQWNAYQQERLRYNKHLYKQRCQYIQNEVVKHKGNAKHLYKLVSSLTGIRSENPLPECENDEELSERFAEYFSSKIEKIRGNLDKHQKFNPPINDTYFKLKEFKELNDAELMKIIKTKSCEIDVLPTYMIKENLELFIHIIRKIVNASLREGYFHSDWKKAVLRPLLKKVTLQHIEPNYRPVSNLPFISKITEKAAINQLFKYSDLNGTTAKHHSAYKEGHSCETALIKLTNNLLWAMENKKVTTLICLDLSAAFDTVDHDILLKVLENSYGVKSTALQWFDSYLSDHLMSVCIGESYSSQRELRYSVPQGSCGGPVLFNCYSSSIISIIPENISIAGFADDHTIRKSFNPTINCNEEIECVKDLENCLINIGKWMDQMHLKMNPTKTEFILFGSHQQLSKCCTRNIKVIEETVTQRPVVKYLGAWLDNNLSFKQHVLNRCKFAICSIYKLMHIRRFIDKKTCEILVYSYVLSRLDYVNALLPGISNYIMNYMQRVQNWAAKLVLKRSKLSSSVEARMALHWLPIKYRIDFKLMLIVHKCLKGETPTYLSDLIQYNYRRGGLRNNTDARKLLVPYVKNKTLASRAFSVYAPRMWNNLPITV